MLRPRAFLLAAPLLAPSSCEPTEIRIRTEIAPDASCTREVLFLFPEAEEEGKKTGEPAIPERLILPEREAWPVFAREKRTLLARGFFSSPADIPADFRFRGRREGRVVDRAISHRREDFVFLERHRYVERFREPVDRDAMEASLAESVEVFVALGKAVLRGALDPDFDLAEVDRWMDEEGARLLRSLALLWWESLRDPEAERLAKRAAARLAREGIAVRPEDFRGEDASERLRLAFARKIATLVRPPRPRGERTPAPLPPSAVENLLASDRLASLFEEKVVERFGSRRAGEKWLEDRHADLVGDFGGADDKSLRFDGTLSLPGEILRTNGVLLSPNEVLWRFTSGSLFPNGAALEAESVVLRPGALGALSGSKGFLDKRGVLDLIEALTDEKGALRSKAIRALEKALEAKSLDRALAAVAKVDEKVAARLREILRAP